MTSQARFAILASATVLAGGLAFGQATTRTSPAMDTTFAKKAAIGGMSEVKLGHLAEEKGSNAAVKDFGKRMVADHSKANDTLKQVASKNNIQLPENPDKKEQDNYNRLSKLTGAAFDRAYAEDMVMDHDMDVAEFRKEASSGKNADIKGFASETLPTLVRTLEIGQRDG